jgi:hypothetical protein
MLLARGGRSLTLGWVGLHILKMLKLAEDAHIKSMSTFETDEHLQRGHRTFGRPCWLFKASLLHRSYWLQ